MENLILELQNIQVQFLEKDILHIPYLAVHQFDRIGIVGKNGAGKSTLLKLLSGELVPQQGSIMKHVDPFYVEQINPPLPNDSVDINLMHKLQADNAHSGGEQMRLKIAHAFSHYYEAMLLDEPTTHLDQQGIHFLTEQLEYYYGALLIVSHDRALLDATVTTIWEIEDGQITVYTGNYADYEAQKMLERTQQQAAFEKYEREKRHLEKAAAEKMKKAEKITSAANLSENDKRAKANRMVETKSKGTSQKAMHKAAKAIKKRMEQLQAVDPVQQQGDIRFYSSLALTLHNKIPIMLDQLTLSIDNHVLLHNVRMQIALHEKVAITGPNGSGKSTLLQSIAKGHPNIIVSPKVKFGVFSQLAYQSLPANENVLSFIQQRSDYREAMIRSVLHQMQFDAVDLQKNIQDLSGGERIRLLLCVLFLGHYNVLLLDEPTNFLDMYTKDALARFIKAYNGTVLFVTHDAYFTKQVATRVFDIKDKQLIEV